MSHTANQYVISSAFRTLQVLLAFSAPPHRFSLAEMAGRLDLDRSQTYRCLKTLEEAGFLSFGEDDRFGLTSVLSVLNSVSNGGRTVSLAPAAGPHMDRLAQQTQETVNLFTLVGDTAVCVDRRESQKSVRLISVLGLSVNLHAGAVPKAIFAYLPPADQERILARLPTYPRYTPNTQLNPEKLRRELEETRQRGYSISDGDFDLEAIGVGAPIFDQNGRVVGGISVGGPAYRMTADTLLEFGELIIQTGRTVSRQLGFAG
jgi:DNA-binding IclR family transcriptional regulator